MKSKARFRKQLGVVVLAALFVLAATAGASPAWAAEAAASDEEAGAAAPATSWDDPAFLGKIVMLYELDEARQLFSRANVTVGHPGTRTTHAADRVVLGERGLYLHWGLTSMFFPAHSFTLVEINAQDAGSLIEMFASEALWRRSWGHGAGGLLNFAYEVDGTTYNVAVTDALITPEYLVMSLNSGHTLRIVKFEVIERIEIVQ